MGVMPVRRVWTSRTSWNVELAWWLARLPESACVFPQPNEVQAWAWCTVAQMQQLPSLLSSNKEFISALAAGEIRLEDGDG